MYFKNLYTAHEFKLTVENKTVSPSMERLFEAGDFSNRTEFHQSLLGRFINRMVSFGRMKFYMYQCSNLQSDLEMEYLAGVLRLLAKKGYDEASIMSETAIEAEMKSDGSVGLRGEKEETLVEIITRIINEVDIPDPENELEIKILIYTYKYLSDVKNYFLDDFLDRVNNPDLKKAIDQLQETIEIAKKEIESSNIKEISLIENGNNTKYTIDLTSNDFITKVVAELNTNIPDLQHRISEINKIEEIKEKIKTLETILKNKPVTAQTESFRTPNADRIVEATDYAKMFNLESKKSIGKVLGDDLLKDKFPNLSLALIDNLKVLKKFEKIPNGPEEASRLVNTERVGELQLAVNRMCGEDLPKESGDYQRRINGQLQDTDKAKIQTYWKKLIRETYAKFRYFLDFSIVDPERIIKKDPNIKNKPFTKMDNRVDMSALVTSLSSLISPNTGKISRDFPEGICYANIQGQKFGLILNYIEPRLGDSNIGCGCFRILGLLDIVGMEKNIDALKKSMTSEIGKYIYDDDEPIEALKGVREMLLPSTDHFHLKKNDTRNEKSNVFWILPGTSVWDNKYKDHNSKTFSVVLLDKDFRNPVYYKIGDKKLDTVSKKDASSVQVNTAFKYKISSLGYKEYKIRPENRWTELLTQLISLFPLAKK